jgi:flagellin
MLSLHTNAAALTTENALATTQMQLNQSLTDLGTGYRVNQSSDDAAGLQIATRLNSQTQGMQQAQSNTANGISLLQTADGALSETSNILLRMKDLATEAATASSSSADQQAMQSEYDALGTQLAQIVTGTTFGGMGLFSSGTTDTAATGGALSASMTFQIGDANGDTMTLNASTAVSALAADFSSVSVNYTLSGTTGATTGAELTGASQSAGIASAAAEITTLTSAINAVGALRSQIGAGVNRLNSVSNNLTNMITNTTTAQGQIMDVDYASETAKSSADQLQMQAGTAALKQANSMASLVVSLLQS